MSERALKIYGIGKRKSRIPSTGVMIWFLLSAAFWFLFAFSYFGGQRHVDYPALVLAVIFTACFGLIYFRSKQTGLKC